MSGIFQNTHIVPDFILTIENGVIQVNINRRNAPELHVSNGYQEILKGYKAASTKSKEQKKQYNSSNKTRCCAVVYRCYTAAQTNPSTHH